MRHKIQILVTQGATQLDSSRMPGAPDFSGWNWVADSGPFSTAARKRVPCRAQVSAAAERAARRQIPALAAKECTK